MAAIVTFHLDAAERRVVEDVCRAEGHTVRRLSSVEVDALPRADAVCLLAAAHDESELRAVRRAVTDAPQHWYAVGAPVGARQLLCTVQSHPEVLPFLLPPDPEEFRTTLRRLAERHLQHQRRTRVVAGTKALDHKLMWRTADVDAGATARYVAQILEQAGFYAGLSQLDQVALSLEEAIVNAVEHGNLELDSALRASGPGTPDAYEELRASRLGNKKYGDRPLKLGLRLGAEDAMVTITDAGPGFDTTAAQERVTAERHQDRSWRAEDMTAGSGKGFDLIARWFDAVELSDGGRTIALTRRRQHPT